MLFDAWILVSCLFACSSHEEKLKQFESENSLKFSFFQAHVNNEQCRPKFDSPSNVVSTLDLKHRTNYTNDGGDYAIPQLPVNEVAYGPGEVFIVW